MRNIGIIVSIGMSLMLGIIANPLMVLATPGVDEHTKLFLRFDDGSGNKAKDKKCLVTESVGRKVPSRRVAQPGQHPLMRTTVCSSDSFSAPQSSSHATSW